MCKLSFPKSPEAFATALEILNLPSSIAESNIRLGAAVKTADTLRRLLDSVAFPLPVDSLPKTGSADLRRNLGWAINFYRRHWKVIFEWIGCTETPMEGPSPVSRLGIECLSSIRTCYTFSSKFCHGTSLDQQAVCIWLQCGADMLASTKSISVPDIQHVLCQQLNEAVQIAHSFPDIAMFIEETFLPILIDISKSETRLQLFNSTLQVSTFGMI